MEMDPFNNKVLAQVGIRCVNTDRGWFKCLRCGQRWSPDIQTGGRYLPRWWLCPNECNARRRLSREGRFVTHGLEAATGAAA